MHPYAKMPLLPLILNIFFPVVGTTAMGCLKEGGACFKTIALGIISTLLIYNLFFWLWWTLVAPLISFLLWVFNLYVTYLAYKKCQ